MPTLTADADTDLTVLVVEDHEMMREALTSRLRSYGAFSDIVLTGNVDEALNALDSTSPDMVIIDHSLPDGSGMDVLTAVRSKHADTAVVMLSAQDDAASMADYLARGATGYAHKTVSSPELLRILQSALAGERALDTFTTSKVLARLDAPAAAPSGPLSPREVQVLSLVATGHTNEDIAEKLFISAQTVKTHLTRIFSKLGVRDRAAAAAKAIRDGMLD